MSTPSNWPLPPQSTRFVIPHKTIIKLIDNKLSRDVYPLGAGYYQHAKGHRMERLTHDDHLLIYCIEGKGKIRVNQKNIAVNSGDLVVLTRGTAHQYASSANFPWTIYWCHFDGVLSDDFINHLEIPIDKFVIHLGLHSNLVNEFEALLEARHSSYHLNAFINAANQLRQILTHIALLQPLVRSQDADSFDLEKIHSLMHAHIHEQLNIDTLASCVNLSKFHFIKRYKEATSTTPINHFIQLKIERACHLLDISTRTIAEIAFMLGYNDAYYFSRIFKKIMGISPTQYRKLQVGAWSYKSF
ncbi:AraC family transcriptional regulator [Marinomonas flavescens]|uniref:AraC family transcriptional regulator n=1 Tax=Marinomonas flavescens TaxID=2529379 RepID=UPI00140493DE|nr:AraC family transcriptional regulator [Marinomonas flavescens]